MTPVSPEFFQGYKPGELYVCLHEDTRVRVPAAIPNREKSALIEIRYFSAILQALA